MKRVFVQNKLEMKSLIGMTNINKNSPFRLIGAFVTNSSDYSFVIEDRDGVCGYVLAALDGKIHNTKLEVAWVPAMTEKYPKPEKTDVLTPAEVRIWSLKTLLDCRILC